MNIRELKDRLILGYPAQVEFIRFRDIALESDMRIKQFEAHVDALKRQRDDALEEIERLMKECVK